MSSACSKNKTPQKAQASNAPRISASQIFQWNTVNTKRLECDWFRENVYLASDVCLPLQLGARGPDDDLVGYLIKGKGILHHFTPLKITFPKLRRLKQKLFMNQNQFMNKKLFVKQGVFFKFRFQHFYFKGGVEHTFYWPSVEWFGWNLVGLNHNQGQKSTNVSAKSVHWRPRKGLSDATFEIRIRKPKFIRPPLIRNEWVIAP